ncbi:MAG: hypothetical protein MMC33_002056 [Icmadophila ericetorum]|nr:hypothetical protein [Icmadophila ericetorum]
MATSSTHNSADTTAWANLIENAQVLPHTDSTRMIIERWFQLAHNRTLIANACGVNPADVTIRCVEASAPFICLRVEKPGKISKPVPDKTLIIVAIGQLYPGNGMFTKVNLSSGEHVILSGNENQIFTGKLKGGGMGIILRLKFKPKW